MFFQSELRSRQLQCTNPAGKGSDPFPAYAGRVARYDASGRTVRIPGSAGANELLGATAGTLEGADAQTSQA